MQQETMDPIPSPEEPETMEPTPSQEDPDDIAASNNAAGAEGLVARAESDSPEATATSLHKQDAVGNPGLPEGTADSIPSSAEPGTTEPTPPQEDLGSAAASKNAVGAESQAPAAPSNASGDNLLLTAGGSVTKTAEDDDGGCFEPFIAPAPVFAAPKLALEPKPRSFMHIIDAILREDGILPTPTDITQEAAPPAPDGGTTDAEMAQPSEIPAAPVEPPLPPPRMATAAELVTWIKRCLLAQTHLPDDAAELIAFWMISTHFQDALTVLPCLVLTGAAYEANRVLRALGSFCRGAKLLSGFRRSDLGVLHGGSKTNLIWQPNLDKRTADLLSNLTDRNFLVVRGPDLACFSKSAAIFAGENPETHRILNSIHIHLAPTDAEPSAPPQWLHKMIERLPIHLSQYRNRNINYVRRSMWAPSGLSSAPAAIAAPLGRCLVDAPELQLRLEALLKTEDKQRRSELSNTIEAIVLEATLTLCRDGREFAFAREVAAEANRLLEARGESARLSPEKAGHRLHGLGLRTHKLSRSGNGVTFDKATVARIHELASMYMVDVMEDAPAEDKNLHSSQTTENKQEEEDEEVMEDF